MQKILLTILLFSLSILLQNKAYAQKSFNIDKGGKVKRIKYYVGQDIRLKYNDSKIIGQITALGDSSITVQGINIPISTIDYVIHPRQAFIWWFLRNAGYRAGVGYFILDAGNRLINNDSPVVDDHTITVSVPLIGIGAIGSLMKNKRFRNNGYNMNVNDMSIIK
tara:strand:+ start:6261 stop:6755 length:495 start_codon:yes stop_codon:yes gene_type:complete